MREIGHLDRAHRCIRLVQVGAGRVLTWACLQHQAGNKEAARAEYQRFLELWKNADADRPELKEAREYLAS